VRELLIFTPLAVLSNSLLPLPFEPVLIAFAAHEPLASAWALVAWGAAGAAVGEALNVRLLGRLARRAKRSTLPGWLAAGHKRFYLWSMLIAASPMPIYLARAAAVWRRPRPLLFGLCVGIGRVPRYALILAIWRGAVESGWLTALLRP
jgi:membrane protein YqaA with SNARE-associated domain